MRKQRPIYKYQTSETPAGGAGRGRGRARNKDLTLDQLVFINWILLVLSLIHI